jgi:hypothetical protein
MLIECGFFSKRWAAATNEKLKEQLLEKVFVFKKKLTWKKRTKTSIIEITDIPNHNPT